MSTSAVACEQPTTPSGGHLSVVRTEADQLTSQLCELAGHIHAAQAELVALLGRLAACGGWQGVGIRSIGHWASIELGIDARTASAQAKAGLRLSTVPAVAAAARAGELGWDKVRLLCQVVEPHTQARWLGLAHEMSVGQLARVVAAYRRAADDAADPDADDRARRRRGIWLFDEPDGLVRLTALLEPDDAAVLRAALAAHVELLWRNPDEETHVRRPPDADAPATGALAVRNTDGYGADQDQQDADEQDAPAGTNRDSDSTADHVEPATASEVDPTLAAADPLATRRVDALVSLLRSALSVPGLPDLADDTTQVVLHIDHDLLTGATDVGRSHHAHGPSVPVATARRLCCDALIRPLVHRGDQPLDLGRSARTVSRAQRRALRHRDSGTCAFPGCTSQYWLDVHHVVHWAQGGATDLDNLVLLCRHHHRLHHEGGYAITLTDGRPRFRRPDGTRIGPPPPPPPDAHRGAAELRRRHRADGTGIDRLTARARSGGAPHWSPQQALDGLLG